MSIHHNSGASLEDVRAIGAGGQNIREWQRARGIDRAQQVSIRKLAHMRYQHPDLDEITVFMKDFGMDVVQKTEDEVWYRGYGTDAYVYYAKKGPRKFLGGTFEVDTYEDLEKAARIDGATAITAMNGAPGGGHILTLRDPEGHAMNLIHGQAAVEAIKSPEKLIINHGDEKPRVKKFQRFEEGPAAVHKLGHYGLCVNDFEGMMDWYTRHFNIVPSDLLTIKAPAGGTQEVAIFAHIDRGTELVDHHSIFLSKAEKSHVHHCSFEVHDMDSQQLGHHWLASKNYRSVWGVGRHILGSQLFDYWWDTTGNMIEHYADGDLVDESTPLHRMPAGNESLYVWGPDVPATFLD
ncbi:Glyoxalase/Bleomycin resistance protein/Dihydroxybiphenyl dioxygenase [Sarocladium strictum]